MQAALNDPIRVLLHDLINEVCQSDNETLKDEVSCILNEIIDRVIDQTKCPEFQNYGHEKNDEGKKTLQNDVCVMSSTDKRDVIMSLKSDEDEVTLEIVKDVLESLKTSVCNEMEKISENEKDKNDRDIAQECLNDLIKEVCRAKGENYDVLTITEKRKIMCSIAERKRSDEKDKLFVQRVFKENEKERYLKIAERCLQGFGFCLRRFHEHYKSQYAMAHFLAKCTHYKVSTYFKIIQ